MTKPNDAEKRVDGTRRELLRGALTGGGAMASVLGTGMGVSSLAAAARSGEGHFPAHPKWNFVFINLLTTTPFFVPTQYGAADACAALGCSYQWTGSQKSIASVMVDHMNTAINGGADGIAVALVDPNAFNEPVDRALRAGIPVVAYNADAKNNNRLAYIGQDLFLAGKAVGKRIAEEVDSGDVAAFITTPGQLNIQPRMDGAKAAIKASGKDITVHEVATGPLLSENYTRVESFYIGHRDITGMFAVDGSSTEAMGRTMAKHKLHEKGIKAGGFDLLPGTLAAIRDGDLDFTIDQQPYLQGFYPVMELFLYQLSGGLSGPANINTGLKFVTKANVGPYLQSKSRFEGSSRAEKRLRRSGPIAPAG